ncbi:hypothetical protein [Saccharopolyspora mangrovi]|uniref:Uncharacterized protein n=1 Tax=Saccharopolyspora mangrovi TaxID=3082379 RepID=A0ABU6ACH1_9PSEU|nr:hypothetical protein [Saccharopolyspora sp. S2-29]MEB3369235.1 hypothetical protein [Saccharopolyspora sp. S2-29]
MGRDSSSATLPRPPGLRGPLTTCRLQRVSLLGSSLVLLGLLPSALGGPDWLRAAGLVPGFGVVFATPAPSWSGELVPWLLLHLLVLLAVVAGLLTGVQRALSKGDYLALPAVIITSMLVAAVLAAVHDGHGHRPQEWVPWAQLVAVLGVPAALLLRERRRGESARKLGDSRRTTWTPRRARSGGRAGTSRPTRPTERGWRAGRKRWPCNPRTSGTASARSATSTCCRPCGTGSGRSFCCWRPCGTPTLPPTAATATTRCAPWSSG